MPPPQRPVQRPTPVLDPRRRPGPPVRPAHPLAGRDKEMNYGSLDGFVKAYPKLLDLPARPPLHPPTLYAVIGTWCEGDVVEAAIQNCYANGCARVFIVDNASPDDTCHQATLAGATIARSYVTQFYDDDMRLRLMNEVMKEVTERERIPNLWWLSLDADEFPCGPQGERVIDYLSHLDQRITCVGANALDLYPTEPPHYTVGMHPADCMTMGLRRKSVRGVFCASGHWKHPLLRYQHGNYEMAQSRGSHTPFVRNAHGIKGPPFFPQEPAADLMLFHAPFRAKDKTLQRLQLLCTKQTALAGQHRSAGDDHFTGGNGAIKRWRSLEDVYAGNWHKVELPHSQAYGAAITGIAVYPWRTLLPQITSFPRWYSMEPIGAKAIALPVVDG